MGDRAQINGTDTQSTSSKTWTRLGPDTSADFPGSKTRSSLTDVVHTNVTSVTSSDFHDSPLGHFTSALPSVEDLKNQSQDLFNKIKNGNHAEVERLLSDRGHKVDIVPRIGCSALHYSKLNIANWEAENGDNPLIMAARVDSKMVKLILKYGGNPNHANKDRDIPLSVAASRYDKDSIDALLRAGANLRAAVVKLTSLLRYVLSEKQLKGHGDVACTVKPLTTLLSDDVYLKCRCPIKTAFDVGRDIASIKNVRNEFKIEFELLISDANTFACKFMNNIDRMWEAREVLTFPVDLIRMAIDEKKKKFVSHPFSQQIIHDRWYDDLAHKMLYGKSLVALKYLISPLLVPPLLLKFLLFDICRGRSVMDSTMASLMRFKFTPCLCFFTDAVNYLIFLAVLIGVCVSEQDTGSVTYWEYALYVCVISRMHIELDLMAQQGWKRYFANIWNHVDILMLVLLSISALYKGCIHTDWFVQLDTKDLQSELDISDDDFNSFQLEAWSDIISHYRHFLNISYIYAVTEFVLFIRLLTLLEFTRSMGPMLIALKYLLADVLKFSVVLATTVLGTSITIYSMSVRLDRWSNDINVLCKTVDKEWYEWHYRNSDFVSYINKLTEIENINTISDYLCYMNQDINIEPPQSFGHFLSTVRSIMWSTFGLFDVEVSRIIS